MYKKIILLSLICILQIVTTTSDTEAQSPTKYTSSSETAPRAVRRDVPLTNSIRRAFEAGTRDFSGRPGPNYWQLKTDYEIYASIDPETQEITGTETITLHNNSPDELKQIVLRLDHNLFRPRVPRGFSVPAETTDGMVITSLSVDGVAATLNREQGGSGSTSKISVSGLKQTVAQIKLVTPIKPKGVSKIRISWNTKLPGGPGQGHRMTQRWGKKVFQPTQWFPRIAKYDDLRGWETSVYLGPSEFYNNFGRFDVKIEMPAGWLVSATGVLQNPEELLTETVRKRLAEAAKTDEETMIVREDERSPGQSTAKGGKLVWHYVADNVNDFAWATSNEYVWRATRAVIPGKGVVPIHMLYLPERARRFERAGAYTRHALKFYSELWGTYPFPHIILQDGPSAGMEYPMVINSNQGAADHEVAHQWFPMMLGTNETRYAWMDEGFNQYANIISRAKRNGKSYTFDKMGQRYGSISGGENEAPMMWNANHAGTGYGFQAYGKTALMLSMLGGIVGDDNVQAAFKKYVEAWRFKHPSPWDFMFFMNNELKQDLGWFWYYWLFTTESVDGSIKSVKTDGNKAKVVIHQAGQMPSPVVLKVELAPGPRLATSLPGAKFIDENTVVLIWPVDVWFGGNRNFAANLDFGSRKITRITLDPYGRFPDRDPKDNVWSRKDSP